MKTIFTFLFASVFLSSCVQLNYIGSSYPATKNVDVYVDPSAIRKPYTIMGKSMVDNTSEAWSTPEKIQAKAITLAMNKGADAILIRDPLPRYDGNQVHTETISGSSDRGHVTTTNGTITPNISHERNILFLKYQ